MPLESLSISKKERERKEKTEDESDSADRLNNHLPPELYTEEPSCNSYMTDGEALDSAAEDEDQIRWVGSARVSGPPWMKNFLVTCGFLGFTSVWAIENSQVSPFLIDLGLSRSWVSLALMAGPLSGLIMQPLIGIMSDRCNSSWGRRRPFIVGGMILTVIGMLLLGWTRELGSLILGEGRHQTLNIIIAIFSVFLVDFAVSAVQAADRALLVDTLPQEEQESGNAWAGMASGFGRVAAFWIGNVNLPQAMPSFGKTQLQALSIITSIILLATHALTIFTTHERVQLPSASQSSRSFLSNFRPIISTTRSLPPDIRTVCFVQFFAWIAWFPILFFTSVWVADLYTANAVDVAGIAGTEVGESLYDEATRAGSRALFFSALVAFLTAVLLPFVVDSEHRSVHSEKLESGGWRKKLRLPIEGLSLPLVWCLSLGIFSFLLGCTYFVGSVWAANLLIGLTGFCWSVTYWAPFAILGELIRGDHPPTSESLRLRNGSYSSTEPILSEDRRESHVLLEDEERDGEEGDKKRQAEPNPLFTQSRHPSSSSHASPPPLHSPPRHLNPPSPSSRARSPRSSPPPSTTASNSSLESPLPLSISNGNTATNAGAILGIHNLFIVLPQFIITFLSSVLFYLFEPPKLSASPEGDTGGSLGGGGNGKTDGVGFIFRLGGVSAAVACWLCWRFMRRMKAQKGR